MSHTVPLEQAAARLGELVRMLKPGDEIVLTQHDQPVARLLPSEGRKVRRQPGSCKGMLVIHEDDEQHLKDFAEYMP